MSDEEQVVQNETWPKKLNKALILVGLLAFGLVVIERFMNSRESDAPTQTADVTVEILSPEQSVAIDSQVIDDSVADTEASSTLVVTEALSGLQNHELKEVDLVAADSQINDQRMSELEESSQIAIEAVTQGSSTEIVDETKDLVNAENASDKLSDSSTVSIAAATPVIDPIKNAEVGAKLVDSSAEDAVAQLQDNLSEADPQLALLTTTKSNELTSAEETQLVTSQTNGDNAESLSLESVFGSRVVFVSASEPAYVITENAKRYDVGGIVQEGILLAAVSVDGITLEKDAEQTVLSLPEPGQ